MKHEFLIGGSGGIVAAIISAALGSLEIFLILFVFYGIVLLANVSTGVFYANQTNTYDKAKARSATYMKAGMIVAMILVAITDVLLIALSSKFGIPYHSPVLTAVFVGYQIVHEFASTMQNIKKLGNKIPNKVDNIIKDAEQSLNDGKIPDIPFK